MAWWRAVRKPPRHNVARAVRADKVRGEPLAEPNEGPSPCKRRARRSVNTRENGVNTFAAFGAIVAALTRTATLHQHLPTMHRTAKSTTHVRISHTAHAALLEIASLVGTTTSEVLTPLILAERERYAAGARSRDERSAA